MYCYFELRERLREDVRGHFIHGAILHVDVSIRYGLAYKMESDVNMFGAGMVVVVSCEAERGLVVAK